ncbi:hypothetical protein DFH08DRAFT_686610 [Mycena albidolilacea]|uniref:Uncharacterized protein n=1 Tax=Mycena albidolilacea TaxID=1033008 RepID=A0AAD7AIE7_9AGAR|nr:hypothetical protein DFH08DRAFT_686610 [Mycena albidolilacea]
MGDPLRDDSWPVGKGVTLIVLQNPLRTRVHATGEEAFIVPPHWHAFHGEHHIVLKGRICLTQDGVSRILRPEDGVCVTPAGVVHSIETFAGEETILEETTVPSGETKVIFFRNLFYPSVTRSFLRTMQVFYYGDAYPELPLRSRWLEWLMVVVVGGWVAGLLGYQIPDKRLRLDQRRFPPSKKD